MPDFNSNIITREGQRGAAGLADPTLYQASVRFVQATVTIPSTLAANDRLRLATLPAGAQVVPSMSQAICHADPGTTLRLNVGDSGNTSRYASALNLDAGGVVNFAGATIPAQTTSRAKLATETEVFATITSAAAITNGSVITFLIAYFVG